MIKSKEVAATEANSFLYELAVQRQNKQVRAAHAAGRPIVTLVNRRSEMSFDPVKASPRDAQKLIAQVAKLLGVEDPEHADHATIDKALDALFAAVTGGDTTKSAIEYPKEVDKNALRLGQQRLGWR